MHRIVKECANITKRYTIDVDKSNSGMKKCANLDICLTIEDDLRTNLEKINEISNLSSSLNNK